MSKKKRDPSMKTGTRELSLWFNLSYASWLTLPRVLMEAMPDEWQGRMADLLNEYDEVFHDWPDVGLGTRVQVTRRGRLTKTPDWLIDYRHPDDDEIRRLKGR